MKFYPIENVGYGLESNHIDVEISPLPFPFLLNFIYGLPVK